MATPSISTLWTTAERNAGHGHEEPTPHRRLHSPPDRRAAEPDRHRRSRGTRRHPPGPQQPAERESRPYRRDGTADREGVRAEGRPPDAHAAGLRSGAGPPERADAQRPPGGVAAN